MLRFLLSFLLFGLLIACNDKKTGAEWSRREGGYYYKLIYFENEDRRNVQGNVAWLHMTCLTQDDSVFWDSGSNSGGHFFLEIQDPAEGETLMSELFRAAERDSFELLVPVETFFKERFGLDSVPQFGAGDSVVKTRVGIKAIMARETFDTLRSDPALYESIQINSFFGDALTAANALDPAGFYWLRRPSGKAMPGGSGRISVWYRGYFMNGRVMESGEDSLHITNGEPMQLLKGLNNVIGKLKPGENAKIIIPSALAYGDSGNSSGMVPPYTPLIYEIGINSEN